jgi:hypothetical protein
VLEVATICVQTGLNPASHILAIIGPIFFDATITTAAYMKIFNTFVNQLDDEKLSIGYFLQDGAVTHNYISPHNESNPVQILLQYLHWF